MSTSNVSADLIWEITRTSLLPEMNPPPKKGPRSFTDEILRSGSYNAFKATSKTGGSPRFSRDPLNLLNVESRKVDF